MSINEIQKLFDEDLKWWKKQIKNSDSKKILTFTKEKSIINSFYVSSNAKERLKSPLIINDQISSNTRFKNFKRLKTILPPPKKKQKKDKCCIDFLKPLLLSFESTIPTVMGIQKIRFQVKQLNQRPKLFYPINLPPLILPRKAMVIENHYKPRKKIVNMKKINELMLLKPQHLKSRFEYKNLNNDKVDHDDSIILLSSPLSLPSVSFAGNKRHCILNREAFQYISLIEHLMIEDIEIHERALLPGIATFISEPGCTNVIWNPSCKICNYFGKLKISRLFMEGKGTESLIATMKILNPSMEIISNFNDFQKITFGSQKFMSDESSWERFLSSWKEIDPWKCQLDFISKEVSLIEVLTTSKHSFSSQ